MKLIVPEETVRAISFILIGTSRERLSMFLLSGANECEVDWCLSMQSLG